MADPFDLKRFVAAQEAVFDHALAELRAGEKRSHWMWFVFPQLRGLGASSIAIRFGTADLAEAKAYLAHPLLGRRLLVCTEAALAGAQGRTLNQVLGYPDDLKFVSCMTLFAAASETQATIFREALDRLCGGHEDARTLALLQRRQG